MALSDEQTKMRTNPLLFRFMAICALLAAGAAAIIVTLKLTSTAGKKQPNVILILADALRADHLGCYGYSRPTSPNLDQFAAGAVLFTDARSQSSATFPSANSLLTSRMPEMFPADNFGIPANIPSLATILKNAGYKTMAVSASPIVLATKSIFNPHGGFGAGFDKFEEYPWRNGERINRAVKNRHDRLTPPFFLFLHYMDTHDPYVQHGARNKFAKPYNGKDFIRKGNPNPIADMLYANGPKVDITSGDIQHLIDLYDNQIAAFDKYFAGLTNDLASAGLLDNTIIAVISDHGQEFMEHNNVKHGHSVYDALLKVPLLVHLPSVPPAKRTQPVQNLDILPTILDYAGIPSNGLQLEGRSLRPAIEKNEPLHGSIVSTFGYWRSIYDGRYKLIVNSERCTTNLFDIANDPGETLDLAATEPEIANRLTADLRNWQDSRQSGRAGQDRLILSADQERALKSVGYLR